MFESSRDNYDYIKCWSIYYHDGSIIGVWLTSVCDHGLVFWIPYVKDIIIAAVTYGGRFDPGVISCLVETNSSILLGSDYHGAILIITEFVNFISGGELSVEGPTLTVNVADE